MRLWCTTYVGLAPARPSEDSWIIVMSPYSPSLQNYHCCFVRIRVFKIISSCFFWGRIAKMGWCLSVNVVETRSVDVWSDLLLTHIGLFRLNLCVVSLAIFRWGSFRSLLEIVKNETLVKYYQTMRSAMSSTPNSKICFSVWILNCTRYRQLRVPPNLTFIKKSNV